MLHDASLIVKCEVRRLKQSYLINKSFDNIFSRLVLSIPKYL